MSDVQKRIWLIAAIHDDDTPRGKIEMDIDGDIRSIYENPNVDPKPAIPEPVYEWIHIDKVEPRFSGHDKNLDDKVELGIRAPIQRRLRKLYSVPVALLLNRRIFEERRLDKFLSAVMRDPFFDSRRNPERFICCFGGVPDYRINCKEKGVPCHTFAGCTSCNHPSNTPSDCHHTCYWHLIGLMLEGRLSSRLGNRQINLSVKAMIPHVVIYGKSMPEVLKTSTKQQHPGTQRREGAGAFRE